MSRTIIGLNDPKTVKRFSSMLAVETAKNSYFGKKMIGSGEDVSAPIHEVRDLEGEAGDAVTYDLNMRLLMSPVIGDDKLEGKESRLKFATDKIVIDQVRGGVNGGGRMTRKRTLHDLRMLAKSRQAEWWAQLWDELCFMYLSGARGVNTGFLVEDANHPIFSVNALQAPDTAHLMYGGAATSKASLVSTDKVTLALIDKILSKASMFGSDSAVTTKMKPIMVDGEKTWVLVLSPFQRYDLKRDTGASGWLELQKSLAQSLGNKAPIFQGALGMYNGVLLHDHENVIRFSDYGAGSNVAAARALFLGDQAACVAFGNSGGKGMRFDWHEETRDNGNEVVITSFSTMGVKKCRFANSTENYDQDYGVISVDTAAADPNA